MAALGSSILVPSVQELAKQQIINVPSQYLHPDQEKPTLTYPSSLQNSIPVIDMERLLNQESSKAELELLHSACKEWGFFQLVNHGVSPSVIDGMKSEMQDFFKLPLEEKRNLWQLKDDVEGYGQAFVVSEEQKLDWSDMFFLFTLPQTARKRRLFDHLPLSFRKAIETYSLEVEKLCMAVLGLMSQALGLEGEIAELFDGGRQSLRMNYYPPCPQPNSTIGLSPHSDGAGLTILLQVNEKEGLQIRKDGMWIPVIPLPNAFIINIGDILEIMSNGIYRSVEHRATVNSAGERLSIAAFHSPKPTTEIGPICSLISPEKPALFKTVGVEKYVTDLFARKLEGRSYIDSLRINQDTRDTAVEESRNHVVLS